VRQTSASIARQAFSLRTIVVFLMALTIGSMNVGPSFAAKKKAPAGNPRYAAVVIDANTGKTLFASNADAQRFPASLTKMMTLYMVFEALQQGKISKSTPVVFSAQASAQAPTKLGVRAGGSITVETAILSLVTKSANDSATALGELLGGSEDGFARMMTAKARQLGMTGSVFRNANGLPNPNQHSTARDMATLGIALREHFPEYYPYFSTRSFTYGKQRIGNHNRLLGRVKGVDGIKTGYTRASGFNLVSSVSDGNRRVVAVVMGGTSGAARDQHMAELLKTYLPEASTRRGGDLVAKGAPTKSSPLQAFAKAILPKKNAPMPEFNRDVQQPETVVAAVEPELVVVEQGYAEPIPERMTAIDPIKTASIARREQLAPKPLAAPKVAAAVVEPEASIDAGPSGWAIQVASSPSQTEAKDFLAKTTKQVPQVLADASAFTVAFDKGGVTYYRARFGGFDSKTAAWNACGALKKKKIACYAVQQ